MATKYTNDIKNLVLDRYRSGEGPTSISRELGIPKPTIWNWIRDPSPLRRPPATRWSKEEELFLSESYGKLTKDEILEQLPGKSKKTLTYKIESMGLRKPEVKPVLDLCQLDSQEKAYIVGFMAADGCITKSKGRNYRISIELSRRDEEHLVALRNTWVPNAKISHRKEREMCSFSFVHVSTAECLFKLGVVQNKTKHILPPNELPDTLVRHYVRGYVDGDGCILNDGNRLRCILVGQPILLDFIRRTFKEEYVNQCSIRSGKGKFAYLEYGNRTAEEFCKWIYKGAYIYLERKYQKAKSFIGGDLCVCS